MNFIRLLLLFLLLLFIKISHAACDFNSSALKALSAQGAKIASVVQTDYGQWHQSASCYLEAWPQSTENVAKLVKTAYQYHVPIRTQGQRHSQNGSSLATHAELIIHTAKLNTITFAKNNIIIAGSGIPVALINPAIAEKSHLYIPIYNGGDIGPSVGGYIAAGGISPASAEMGGFWEHVNAITIVTAYGKILLIKNTDPLFIWLFGSMGQLGIMTSVELKTLPLPNAAKKSYPLNTVLTVHFAKRENQTPIYWFNLFAAENEQQEALTLLQSLQKKYPHALRYFPIYHWKVTFIKQMPPLLFDKQQTFYVMGSWGYANNFVDSKLQFEKLSETFTQEVNQEHFRRYIQAENVGSPAIYQHYFSKEIYTQFKKIKTQLDPAFLFNRGSVFK